MSVVGFNFTKILVERKGSGKGRINIQNNVAIKNVEKANLSFGKAKQEALKFSFEFTCEYEPKIGSIILGGEVIDLEDENTVKDVLESWQKHKRVPQAVMNLILNSILNKSTVQALILSRDINLPPPIPMPRVNVKNDPVGTKAKPKSAKK